VSFELNHKNDLLSFSPASPGTDDVGGGESTLNASEMLYAIVARGAGVVSGKSVEKSKQLLLVAG
jgi:hypothetical protein